MSTAPRRERLRFAGLSQHAQPDGTRRIVVELEWRGVTYRGTATGTGTPEGDLRATGEATVAAARFATVGKASVTLIGTKAIRAFDGRVIIAAVEVRTGGSPMKLLGAYAPSGSDLTSAGALTVLNALNRALGPILKGGPRSDEHSEGSNAGER
jgi:hypothetical protein